MKKVLLISPPMSLTARHANFNVNFPLGPGYIAARLEQTSSYEVVMLDSLIEKIDQKIPIPGKPGLFRFGMTAVEIQQFVTDCKPDYVGVTSMFTQQFENTDFVCNAVKEVQPNTPVVVGGAHATADPQGVLDNKSIDYVVVGEGEEIMLQLLDAIENNEDIGSIPNLCYVNEAGEKIIKPVTFFPDVNSLPLPARHLLPTEEYIVAGERHGGFLAKGSRSISIMTSRGCPFNCNFCSAYDVFGKALRTREVDSVLGEIDELVNKYKVNDVYLADDQFLAPRNRVIEILDGIISKNYGITLDAPNGLSPWLLTEEILIKMKRAGFWRVCLAIESGNTWVLKNIIDKPVKLGNLPELTKLIRKCGLEVTAFLVVGNVSEDHIETFEQMEDSYSLMRELKIRNPVISILSPHIGSNAYDALVRKGYLSEDYVDDDYQKPTFSTPLWSAEELERFVVVQSMLTRSEGMSLFWPLRFFVGKYSGPLLKQRYWIAFAVISLFRPLERVLRRTRMKARDLPVANAVAP